MAACRMKDFNPPHIPVMIQEVISNLLVSLDGIYVDATFGRGSHTRAILHALSPKGRIIAFDKDPEAVTYAQQTIQDKRFSMVHASFVEMQATLEQLNLSEKIDGILFDLGVSSPQLDNPERGFSFLREGKLDMRMNPTTGLSAAAWLAQIDEKELTDVLWEYGEEKFSRRIAHAIVTARHEKPIETTTQLAEIVKRAVPKTKSYADKHPATRTFQAIRIAINEELTELPQGLHQALEVLKLKGRLAVISFHSLEDRIVKQFIKQHEKGFEYPRGLPVKSTYTQGRLKTIVKMLKPSLQEINENPRARSATLRIAEKLS